MVATSRHAVAFIRHAWSSQHISSRGSGGAVWAPGRRCERTFRVSEAAPLLVGGNGLEAGGEGGLGLLSRWLPGGPWAPGRRCEGTFRALGAAGLLVGGRSAKSGGGIPAG